MQSRPISRILCASSALRPSARDNHSSRPAVTDRLQLPTRRLGGPLHRLPIWDCSGWRLPRFTLQPGRTRPEDSSLWPYSARCRGWLLANTLPYGVRTFLPLRLATQAAVAWPALRGASLTPLASRSSFAAAPRAENPGVVVVGRILVGIAPAGNPHDGKWREATAMQWRGR